MYNALHLRYNIPRYIYNNINIGILFGQPTSYSWISRSDYTTNENNNNEIPNINTDNIYWASNEYNGRNGVIRR